MIGFVTFDPYAFGGNGGVDGVVFNNKILSNNYEVLLSSYANSLNDVWLALPQEGENLEAIVARVSGLTTHSGMLSFAYVNMPFSQGQLPATNPVSIPNSDKGVIGMNTFVYIYG